MEQVITTRNHRQMITILTRIPTKDVIPAATDTIHINVRLESLDIKTIETMADETSNNIIHQVAITASRHLHKSVIIQLLPAGSTNFQSTDRHLTTKISFQMIYSILASPKWILRNPRTRMTQGMIRMVNPKEEVTVMTVLNTTDGPIRNTFAGIRNHYTIQTANNTELFHDIYLLIPSTKVFPQMKWLPYFVIL